MGRQAGEPVSLSRYLGVSVYGGVFSRTAAKDGWGCGESEAAAQGGRGGRGCELQEMFRVEFVID